MKGGDNINNLYVLKFTHYAPKDSIEGIITYLIAESGEQIYEWLKSEPEVGERSLFNSYKYEEDENETFDIYDEDYNVIGTETFKERMIRLGGEMYDEDADVSDAYYGVAHYGWELVKDNINYADVIAAEKRLGLKIVDIS